MPDVPTRDEMNAAIAILDARLTVLEAEVVEAKTGETKDIQEAVRKAPVGSSVLIPAGEWDFTGTVIDERGIPIMGSGRDRTRLMDRNPKRDQFSAPMFLHKGKTATISGMTLTGWGPTNRATATYSPQSCKLHAWDMLVEDFGGAGITLRNQVDEALIEDVEFRELYTVEDNHRTMGYGVVIYGDAGTFDLPSGDLVVVDRCRSRNVRHTVASNNAARYRFSNSVIENTDNMNGAGIDAHSDASWEASARYVEIVGNTVQATWYGCLLRGREARVWDNDFTKCGRGGSVGFDYNGRAGVDSKFAPHDCYVWGNTPNKVELRGNVPEDRVALESPTHK